MKEEIFQKIDSYEDYAVQLQKKLVSIPALAPENGGDGEYEKALFLEKELKKLKFDSIEWINVPQKEAKNGMRPNLVARYKGKRNFKTLWIMAHMDIVPPGELSLWNSNPYELKIEERKLIARGAEDNHQAIIAAFLMFRAMMESGFRADFDISLLLCADEETGSGYGADYIAEKRSEIFGKDDMFLVPDSGTEDGSKIEVAEKSILWLKITTRGKQCHASRPSLGINAFRAGSDLVVRLKKLYEFFPEKNELFEPPISTFEPTKKEHNVPNVNTIPGEDVFYLDCRILPCYAINDVKEKISQISKEIEETYSVKINFCPVQEAQAAPPTDPDSPVIKALKKAIKEVYKVEPRVYGIGGGTVAAFFRRLNLPVAVYAKLNETAHQPNEFCILDNILGDAKIFATTALNLDR